MEAKSRRFVVYKLIFREGTLFKYKRDLQLQQRCTIEKSAPKGTITQMPQNGYKLYKSQIPFISMINTLLLLLCQLCLGTLSACSHTTKHDSSPEAGINVTLFYRN